MNNFDGLDKFVESLLEALPETSKLRVNHLKEGAKEMLEREREVRKGFEERLYARWEEPLDLLECLMGLSMVDGQNQRDKLADAVNETNLTKFAASVRIHQRALQVSNEILVLLKAGYADGANARWRTLCELGVIAFFLKNNVNEVSQRYLDHQAVRRYKDAVDFQAYCEVKSHSKKKNLRKSKKHKKLRVKNTLMDLEMGTGTGFRRPFYNYQEIKNRHSEP
jgi:hypothetical protein